MRVLVVEDDLTLAAGLVEGLERAGIRVDLLGAAERSALTCSSRQPSVSAKNT